MKVFKACFIIIKRNIAAFILYFAIFTGLSAVMASSATDNFTADFTALKPNFAIINRDKTSPLSEGLRTFLNQSGSEIILEDKKEAMQDAAFFHGVDYIVILPQGFSEGLMKGEAVRAQTVATTEETMNIYAETLVNRYFNLASAYRYANITEDEIVSKTLSDLKQEAEITKKRFGEGKPVSNVLFVYARMLCYILTALIILCIGNVTLSFRRPDIRMRNLCTPMNPRVMAFWQVLNGAVISFLAWLLLISVGLILYGSNLADVDLRVTLLIALNSLIYSIVAVAVASVAVLFMTGPNSQNIITNFAALGLSFLGGAFVPLEIMSEGMQKASRFTPSHWYVSALTDIQALTSFGAQALAPVWQAFGIQLAFAATLFCVALVISKHQNQSEKFFGSVKTEIEA